MVTGAAFFRINASTISRRKLFSINRPVEMKKILGGGLRIMKYCWPPWLVDKKILRFKSPKTAKKT